MDEITDKQLREALDGKKIGVFMTQLTNVRRVRFAEQRYFELYLKDTAGQLSHEPIVKGTYFAGRGKWIKPWLEIKYAPNPIELELFRLLSDLIPPGGHLMVEYGETEEEHLSTARALKFGIPPAVTPLGYLMWQTGFRAFKDWYFPEGWKEGETKLQGDKPLSKKQEKEMTNKVTSELKKFLEKKPDEGYKEWKESRKIAERILESHGL